MGGGREGRGMASRGPAAPPWGRRAGGDGGDGGRMEDGGWMGMEGGWR